MLGFVAGVATLGAAAGAFVVVVFGAVPVARDAGETVGGFGVDAAGTVPLETAADEV